MSATNVPSPSSWVLVCIAAVGAVGLGGCFSSTEISCETDRDCFPGQTCRDGTCAETSGGGTPDTGDGGEECPFDQESETTCFDGKDNDCDGDTDCEDADCRDGRADQCGKVREGGAGAVCNDEGDCVENNCFNCRDDDGDGDADLQVVGDPMSSDLVVEEECRGREQDGDSVETVCSCAYDPDEEQNKDTDDSQSGVCTGQSVDAEGNCAQPSNYVADETADDGAAAFDDGLDNDCDGTTDERDIGQACSAETDGPCERGICLEGNGICVHQIFVTSADGRGSAKGEDVGGPREVDALCRERAAMEAGGAGREWKAIMSTAERAARARIDTEAPVARMDGALVSSDGELFGSEGLEESVKLDASGEAVQDGGSRGVQVWTGTKADGNTAVGETCDSWGAGSNTVGKVGFSGASGTSWIANDTLECTEEAHFYCISGQTFEESEE